MKISEILQLLCDGRWHRIEEIQQRFGVSCFGFEKLIDFLSEFGFAVIDDDNLRIRVNSDFQDILLKTE